MQKIVKAKTMPKEIKFCPRCALEGIKSDLKNYPNHLLTCGNCQWLGKQVGKTIVEALI